MGLFRNFGSLGFELGILLKYKFLEDKDFVYINVFKWLNFELKYLF